MNTTDKRMRFVYGESRIHRECCSDIVLLEWYCLGNVWRHPANRDPDPKSFSYRQWCHMMSRWPDVRIKGGANLVDDFSSRCSTVCYGCAMDSEVPNVWRGKLIEALATGHKTRAVIDEPGYLLDATFTPFEDVEVDMESIEEFGPYAGYALKGLLPDEIIREKFPETVTTSFVDASTELTAPTRFAIPRVDVPNMWEFCEENEPTRQLREYLSRAIPSMPRSEWSVIDEMATRLEEAEIPEECNAHGEAASEPQQEAAPEPQQEAAPEPQQSIVAGMDLCISPDEAVAHTIRYSPCDSSRLVEPITIRGVPSMPLTEDVLVDATGRPIPRNETPYSGGILFFHVPSGNIMSIVFGSGENLSAQDVANGNDAYVMIHKYGDASTAAGCMSTNETDGAQLVYNTAARNCNGDIRNFIIDGMAMLGYNNPSLSNIVYLGPVS